MSTDWLTELAPEHAPTPGPWWPPAPGWWLLTVAAITGAVTLWYWWRNPRRRVRRTALVELRRLRATQGDPVLCARAIQNLLRRYALVVFGAEQVAALSGEPWLEFLATHGASAFAGPPGRSLLAASYRGRLSEGDYAHRDTWFDAAAQFFRRAPRAVRVPQPVAPARIASP